jgi:hypothetical protein
MSNASRIRKLAELYGGYAPSNVARDAKYSIRRDLDGEMKVHLIYRSGHRERALLSTDLHLPLVHMVNDVKIEVQGAAGGVFYINEWGHVLVKTADRECYYAGPYLDPMSFIYDGREVASMPPHQLRPGDLWPGPHAGIRYIVTADESDIYFEHEERPRRYTRHYLSEESGHPSATRELVAMLTRDDHRAGGGGRIYINEARHFFAPRPDEAGDLEYIYLGALKPDDPWFPEPAVPF